MWKNLEGTTNFKALQFFLKFQTITVIFVYTNVHVLKIEFSQSNKELYD